MRKRTVFPTDEIPHLWAHQTQDEARNQGGNLFFRNETIYSYGYHFPIARLLPERGAVLVNSRSYSNTTNKHQAAVRQAIPSDLHQLYVPDLDASFGWNESHIKNLRHLLSGFQEAKNKMARSKTTDYTTVAHRMAGDVDGYLAVFPEAAKYLTECVYAYGPDKTTIAERLEQARSWELTEAERAAFQGRVDRHLASPARRRYDPYVPQGAQKREEFFEAGGRNDQWLAGQISQLSSSETYWIQEEFGTRLQLFGEQVHTTKGAYVPAAEARKLLRLVRLVKLAGKGERPVGVSIGHYYVNTITADGDLIAGCHTIQNAEIERFAASVGWSEAHEAADLMSEVKTALAQ